MSSADGGPVVNAMAERLQMPTTFRAYQPDQPLLFITSAMWSMHWT